MHALRSACSPRGAPPAALASASRPSAPVRACVSRCHSGRQRAPRTGTVVSPGRFPEPPGSRGESPTRRRRTSWLWLNHRRPLRDLRPDLRPRLPLAPSNQRHRLTPLDEQGASRIRAVLRAGITFFREVILALSFPSPREAGRGCRARSVRRERGKRVRGTPCDLKNLRIACSVNPVRAMKFFPRSGRSGLCQGGDTHSIRVAQPEYLSPVSVLCLFLFIIQNIKVINNPFEICA